MEIGDCTRFVPQGWECPKCGRVYAPGWPFCTACGGKEVTVTNVTVKDGEEDFWKKYLNDTITGIKGPEAHFEGEPTLEDWTRGEYPRE